MFAGEREREGEKGLWVSLRVRNVGREERFAEMVIFGGDLVL